MSEKKALRITSVWIIAVAVTLIACIIAHTLGNSELGNLLGAAFISLFGGGLLMAILAVAVIMWHESFEVKR